ncbi:odorant receptor 85c-like isoform X2 [Fopius arisanus]|uniref:Odorant receptor n=1 Tax=Fopius arisanus TaxID=64838 RepID=A0A9R1T2Q3_9HYME|nr:PREDICTED: odorant receptor 85c-like isoform X2 [Fopius arisanus]
MGGGDHLRFHWNLTSNCLRIIALWPLSVVDNFRGKIVDYGHLIVVGSLALLQGVNMMAMCYVSCENFVAAAESIGPMMSLFIAFGKICIYRYNKSSLRNLSKKLEVCLNNRNSQEYNYLRMYMKYGNIASASVFGSIFILITGYFSIPLILTTHELPFIAYYPWNWRNSTLGYAASYSHQVILTSVLSCACSTEFTYVWYISHCCARLKVVQDKLKRLSTGNRTKKCGKDVQRILSGITRLHADVLDDVILINTAFTYIVLLLFLAAVIAICCAGLTITSKTTESTIILLFLVLAVYYAQQLLFYYLPGDLLAREALAVGKAAYSSGWEIFDVECKKTIGLILFRSNSPPRLLAGDLSPLLLENYIFWQQLHLISPRFEQ